MNENIRIKQCFGTDLWVRRLGFLFFISYFLFSPDGMQAQPKARRQQQAQQQAQQQTQNQGMTMRARLMYPTALDMPEDVVWRRDIYREIDLNRDSNAGLYYPVEPIDKQLNLFTYIFKLALNGYIPVYEYRLDGNEVFNDSSRVTMKTVLDNYHIFYEERNGKLRVDNSDIPSAEVKLYYLKESAYFDQANSSFRRKVLALCPVMLREDDFGGEASKYPLFWVKYTDLQPYLGRQTVMTSNLNNAATMSMEDFFTMNRYEGKIYKTNNMLGRTLAQYCPTDSALAKEQQRIEAELKAFEKNLFGRQQRKDSVDSVALNSPAAKKAAKRAARKSSRSSSSSASAKKKSSTKSAPAAPSGNARMSVRRQRH
ncbi:MAG: gliding motility protein GldN [Prevotella sp.]|nr:gliding motility protein GldN [Prevotella sp.]